MKKFMSVVLATGLILAGSSVVFASGGGGGSDYIKAEDSKVFDKTGVDPVQYPVLLSSGVYLKYESEQAGSGTDDPYLYYYMMSVSVRGDKCYGTGHSSTLIAMADLQATGKTDCSGASAQPNFDSADDNNVKWGSGGVAIGSWVKTDGTELPGTMTSAGAGAGGGGGTNP